MKKVLFFLLVISHSIVFAEGEKKAVFRCDNNYPPYEFVDESGNPAGFNIDILNTISGLMNLNISIVPGRWNDVRRELENGEIDGILGMFYSELRDQKVDFSIPHIITYNSIFVRKGSVIQLISQLKDKEILVQKGDLMDDYLRGIGLTEKIIAVDNSEIALKMLASGKHDCIVMEKNVGQYLIHKNHIQNVVSAGPPILPEKYCIAVKEGDLALLAQLNEGLLAIQATDQYNRLYEKWFSINVLGPGIKVILVYVFSAFSVILILIVGITIWNRQLQRKVREKTTKLSESENKWRTLTQNSPDHIVLVDEHFRIIFANFIPPGIKKKKFTGSYVYEYLAQKDRKRVKRILIDVSESGKMAVFETDFKVLKQGIRVFETRAVSIKLNNGRTGVLSNSRDITKRKVAESELYRLNEELEQRVMERTSDLTASNSELEFFTYSVSHDLRAPLRHITGFTEMLKNELGQDADAKVLRYIETISSSSKKMSGLIDDLLRFSRLGKSPVNKVSINTPYLVEDTITDLMSRETERDIEWIIGPLPVIQGDRAMVNQVFVNILSNAVKYTQKKRKAVIEISAAKKNGNPVVFCVKDNGTGFDMEYYDKLFGVFERLHNEKEFGGTGIGLAFVKRIIEKHGGKVWAESVPDEGSAFYFSFEASSS